MIVMNEPSFVKFEERVKSGGTLIINSSSVKSRSARTDIVSMEVPADAIALSVNNPKASNMVILGAFLKATNFIEAHEMEGTIRSQMGRKPQFLEANLQAFRKGLEL